MHNHAVTMLTVLGLLSSAPVMAQRWEVLGSRRVSFAAERDVIQVGAVDGAFDAIRIDVENGDIEMFDVRVVFGDGSDFSPTTRFSFREGSRSRTIDLPGDARVIRRVSFAYSSRLRRGRATVRLLGRHADHVSHAADRPPVLAGWDHLGSRTVAFVTDRDALAVTGERRFRQLQFVVDRGDLEMYDVRVTFGNGEVFSPTTRLRFDDGGRSRIIDLPGATRRIRSIVFQYRSLVGGQEGRAVVRVYAR